MNNLTDLQAAYLQHYRRFKALGLKPLRLIQIYDELYEPIQIPVFIRANRG